MSWLLCAHKLNEYLFQAIDSCLSQTIQDFELVIVVNGEQREILFKKIQEAYGRDERIKIFLTEGRHLAFSLNLGLHYAASEFIARMDADDISTPDRLEKQIDFMQKNPDISVLGTGVNIIDEHGEFLMKRIPPLDNKSIKKQLKYRNPIFHPTVMFKKSVIMNEGGYLGGIYAEDYDLWLRLSMREDIKFANLDNVCLSYRSVGSGEARRNLLAYASMAGSIMSSLVSNRRLTMVPGLLYTIAKSFILAKR